MKILQLLPAEAFHGGEIATYRLSNELLKMGMEVVVVTSPGLKDGFSRLHATATYVLPEHSGRLPRRMYTYLKMTVSLRRILSRERPDVVHVQAKLARLLMLVSGRHQVIVETLHGVGLAKGEAFQRAVNRISDLLAAASFDEFISVSKTSRGRLSFFGAPMRYIPNSIDGTEFKFVPLNGKEKLVIFVGRLTEVKRPLFFVEAIGMIRPFLAQLGIQVKMIGDGPLEEAVRQAIKRLGLEASISLEGYLGNEEVRDCMARAYAYVTCSITEGMSLALLEAMASGCVVIASSIPANRDVIQNEKTGLLFNGGDTAELAGLIKRVFQEPTAATALAANARADFESNYDARENSLAIVEVYKEAVNSGGRSTPGGSGAGGKHGRA